MQTIFDGTTGGNKVARSSGSGSISPLAATLGILIHGSSSGGGSRRSIHSVPLRSAISPYCGPKSDWKRQYFMVSSLRKGFFGFLGTSALVVVLIDGAHGIGVSRTGPGIGIAKGRGGDGLG